MIGENIRKYRKENNMSQDELAEKLNVSRQSISLWENDQTQPTLENIVSLAKVFNVSSDELLASSTADGASAEAAPVDTGEKKKSKKGLIITVCLIAALLIIGAVAAVLCFYSEENKDENATGAANQSTVEQQASSDTNMTKTKPKAGTGTKAKNNTTKQSQKTNNTPAAQPEAKSKDVYSILKSFAVKNGKLNGDYSMFSKSSDNYGGYAEEDFSLAYWGDTDTVEFCLHCVLDDTYSINFYLRAPKNNNGNYEYIVSRYYRDNGDSMREAKGTINAAEFTESYPLNCTKYMGDTAKQNDFMEEARVGICDLIKCIKKFCAVENPGIDFSDLGFKNF